jgi:hypothetical protein
MWRISAYRLSIYKSTEIFYNILQFIRTFEGFRYSESWVVIGHVDSKISSSDDFLDGFLFDRLRTAIYCHSVVPQGSHFGPLFIFYI